MHFLQEGRRRIKQFKRAVHRLLASCVLSVHAAYSTVTAASRAHTSADVHMYMCKLVAALGCVCAVCSRSSTQVQRAAGVHTRPLRSYPPAALTRSCCQRSHSAAVLTPSRCCAHTQLLPELSHPDVRGAVAARVAALVCQHGAVRLSTKIHDKVAGGRFTCADVCVCICVHVWGHVFSLQGSCICMPQITRAARAAVKHQQAASSTKQP